VSGSVLEPHGPDTASTLFVLVDGVLYVSDTQVSAEGFLRVEPEQDGDGTDLYAGLDPTGVGVVDVADATDVTHVGTKDEGGTTLHQFRVVGPAPDTGADTSDGRTGPGEVVVEMWLDGLARVHRYEATTTTDGLVRRTTSTVSDFGLQVEITAPSDDEIVGSLG
ncbi:MAG: hypothetical protein ACI379_07470, partial [Nocardioides sp.]|uniref:hypothetical protein n=1 Tax=Nocardioides sp. TaxID=35761 RepID=UPI003F057A46